jgi:D-3-phosphoglycerate dehydrogenase
MEADSTGGAVAHQPWRSGPLPRYLIIAALGRTSLEVVPTGLLVHAAMAGGSVALAAHVLAVYTGTAAVTGPWVAAAVDRSARPVRIVRGALVVIAGAYAVLSYGPAAPAVALFAAAVLAALCQPVLYGGWTACLARMVRSPDRPRAAAWDVVTYSVASAAGPTTASTSVLINPRAPLLIAALMVVLAAAFSTGLSVPAAEHRAAGRNLAGVVRAAGFIVRSRRLRQVQATMMLLQVAGAAIVLSAPAISHLITGSYSLAGLLVACLALGAFGTSVAFGIVRHRLGIGVYALAALYGAGAVALAWTRLLPLALVLLLAMGSLNGVLFVEAQRRSTIEVPPQFRGQVLALGSSLRTASIAVATLAFSPPLFVSPGPRLTVAGTVILVACLLLGITEVVRRHPPAELDPSDETIVAPGSTSRITSDQPGTAGPTGSSEALVGSEGTFVLAIAHQSIGSEQEVRELVGKRAHVRYGPLTTDAEAAALSEGADAVIVTLQPLPASRLEALDRTVRVIGRAGVGLDTIDLSAAGHLGLSVVHEPAYCTSEVATHAAALLLAVHRRIGDGAKLIERGWGLVTELGPVPDLTTATLGLVGLGRIGSATAARMAPFVARIRAYDPAVPAGTSESADIAESLDELLATSDLVSLHLPLTEQTRGLISDRELALMRPGSIIVNVSRGALIDERALAGALRRGHLGGAGLDVFEREPLPADSPLRSAPRLTMTPHMASYSDAAAGRMAAWTVDDVVACLTGTPLPHGRLAVRGRAAATDG